MEDLKRVMYKGEIIIIDANKEKDWMSKYLHISGKPFVGVEYTPSDEPPVPLEDCDSLKEEAAYELDASDMQALWDEYVKVTGKNVPARYKNDVEWLKSKILFGE